jgi:uncharacterized protein (TIGR03437 family)
VPGIFTPNGLGSGQGVIFDPNVTPWVLNSAGHRAAKDSIVGIYATGEGQTSPPGQDGRLTTGEPSRATQPVSVTIGGKPAEIVRHVEAPAFVAGLYNLYVKVPKDAPSGCDVPVVLTIGQAVSRPDVTMCVQ